MPIELTVFEDWHAEAMEVQQDQERDEIVLEQGMLEGAVTVLRSDTPLVIGGVKEVWPGRSIAWSFLSKHAHGYMCPITRLVRAYIDVCNFARCELYVRDSFDAAHKWAKMLGFKPECLLRQFKPYEPRGYRNEMMYVRYGSWARQH